MTQETALKKLRSGKNVFLTGRAGTGKTFTLNKYIKECEEKGLTVLKTAPTGIASLNLEGITMHQAFGIPIPAYGKTDKDITLSKIPKESRLADVIIIDEISMCRNDVFEYFSLVYNKISKQLNKKPQIIVCGDFYQLPPVVTEDDKKKLKKFGLDPSGYCFLTPEWKKFKFVFVELTKIYRQNNTELIENLGKLRIGDTSCLDFFNSRVTNTPPTDCTIICSTNAEANQINETQLGLIEGPRCAYGCTRKGRTAKEYSVDDTLFLKPGAKVIFMANDLIHQNYKNGTIGVVLQCFDKSVIVQTDDKEFEVTPYEWKSYSVTVSNGVVNKKEIGTYTQLPLKLAYAITMHKTQGQTYEKCVVSPNSFADGQLYVALSRVINTEGLFLSDYCLPEYIKVNTWVKSFYDNHGIDIPEWIVKKKADLKTKKNVKKTSTSKTAKKATKKTSTNSTKTKVTVKPFKNKSTTQSGTTTKKTVLKKKANSSKTTNKRSKNTKSTKNTPSAKATKNAKGIKKK